jgi:predicted metal-dependent peptidase
MAMQVSYATDDTTEAAKPSINVPDTDLTSNEVKDLLIKARVDMLMNAPFFGALATRLTLVDATEWCPTAATDGRRFYFNRHFTAALTEEECIWLMGHEILHCVYDHMDPNRRGSRIHQLWNVANDYVINLELEHARLGKRIRKEIIEVCFDYKYDKLGSEEVYDMLYEEADDAGRIQKVSFDMHMEHEEGDDEGAGAGAEANADGDGDGKSGPVPMTAEEKEKVKQEFKSATIQAAKGQSAGNLPAGVKRMIDQLLNPQLDWRTLLAMQIQSVIKSDYTFARASRKGMDAGFWLPAMDYETSIDVAIALDMSGSIQDSMARDFLSEVKGIMDQYTGFKIHLFCFDTEVHCPAVFTDMDMDEFMDYELGGGGGTDFDCCFDYMKEEGIQPKKFIMFTDGYPWNSWGDESYCDTLFVVHGEHGDRSPIAPFGITVPYTRKDKQEAA